MCGETEEQKLSEGTFVAKNAYILNVAVFFMTSVILLKSGTSEAHLPYTFSVRWDHAGKSCVLWCIALYAGKNEVLVSE